MAITSKKNTVRIGQTLEKTATGITGFDEITYGGLPKGRPSLICGEAGSGKTLFAIEYLVKGATLFNEPGVFIAFEEKAGELAENVASLGFDLEKLASKNKIRIDYVHIERSEIEETGEYDLDGLFIRLNHAIDSIGAKRIVLDTIENLFSGLDNEAILRAELRRLFQWLKEKKVTAVITAEKGTGMLTREGLEEYVSDCVIVLDNRVVNQVSTRRLRVIKYRGSLHGTNEYPFLIDTDGISVLPVTSLKLEAQVSTSRISSGIPSLDGMLDKGGFYKGTSLLLSGTAGTGKTSVAASFANAACQRNERCIYFAFEESPQQIMRNMHSIGLKLETHVKKGLLKFQASRPTMYGLEMHLVVIHKIIREFKPQTVIIDPITNLTSIGSVSEVQSIITRLIDFLQMNQITTILTGLNYTSVPKEQTDETISSLVDAWIQLRDIEMNGERNRGLYIMKSRGMKHSNQIREVIISDKGLYLEDIYLGADGILTGTAREADRLYKQTEHVLREHILDRRKKELDRKGKELEAKIMALRTEFDHLKEGLDNDFIEEELKNELTADKQGEIKRVRENTTNKINNTIRRQKK